MVRQKTRRIVALAALALFPAAVAFAQTPGQQVQETIQRLTAIVSSPAGSESERLDEVKRLLLPRFVWPEMGSG